MLNIHINVLAEPRLESNGIYIMVSSLNSLILVNDYRSFFFPCTYITAFLNNLGFYLFISFTVVYKFDRVFM